ncbi:MAG: hypothetical protein ABGY75_00960 [Gemmataceae bacterium]
MKNILIVGGVSLVLFSVSFALSVWLNASKGTTAPTAKEEKDGKKKGDDHPTGKSADKDRGEEAKKQEKEPDAKGHDTKSAEPKLTTGPKDKDDTTELRRMQMEVVLHDLRLQREEYEKRTKSLAAEVKAIQAEEDANDARARELSQVEQKQKQKEDELKKRMLDVDKNELARIEQIALMMDKMDAAKAAEIVQYYADGGNIDTVAKILSKMKAAKAAEVFAALSDPSLGPQLIDRMKAMTTQK